MKRLSLSLFLALTMLASATSASIRLPAAGDAVSGAAEVDSELQAVFSPPKAQNGVVDVPHTGGASLNLADVLTVERRASLWWDYARDVASVTSRLTRKGETTLLVPVDRAIIALPRKPHQNADGTPASDKQFAANVEAFLSAHIVPGTLEPGQETATLHEGVSVTVEDKDGAWVVCPGEIKVLGVTEASNGKIYYLDGVVDYL